MAEWQRQDSENLQRIADTLALILREIENAKRTNDTQYRVDQSVRQVVLEKKKKRGKPSSKR